MFRIAITGRPGIGKTTLCLRVFKALREEENISGFITTEVREKGIRRGFRLVNLVNGETEWLAHINSKSRVRVGKYGVEVSSVDKFSRNLEWENSGVVIIDEIGPMELKSKEFIKMIERILSSDKSCLFSIHLKSKHPLLERVREELRVFMIDENNRDLLVDKIVNLIRQQTDSQR
ncbi:MAG TPA: NTPase [Archaeoglobaceae archaeon]|nr:NTPase [Archaeoglobaceae archaeon]